MLPRPPACEGCPANKTARGFIPPTTPSGEVLLAIVGQGGGGDEAAFGEPFIGESGRRLDRWLVQAGIPRERIAVGNVVQCQLPGNRAPHKREVQHCWRAHIRPWLASVGGSRLRVVVPVGVPAMAALIHPDCSASVAGTIHPLPLPWRTDPFNDETVEPTGEVVLAVPILHPAFVMRGQWAQEPAQIDYLRRAWHIATGKLVPDLTPLDEPPPGCNPTPTLAELIRFDLDTGPDEVMACDIEGTRGRLIGVGFCRVEDEQTIYVPILDADQPYWPEAQWRAADTVLRRLLRRPLIFHNGATFDIPFLESVGYEVPRYEDDTMIRHHILYAEQPKGLEGLAVRYLGARCWKWLSHVETEDGK